MECRHVDAGREGEHGMNGGGGADICVLLCRVMAGGRLLCNTGSSAWVRCDDPEWQDRGWEGGLEGVKACARG